MSSCLTKEYFLTFLPEQKNFAYTVKKTARYNRIITALKNKSLEAYLGFMIFFAHEFERFLRIFQYSQPMIYILYPESIRLLQSLMTKFVKKSLLVLENGKNVQARDLIRIDVFKSNKCKSTKVIDIGTSAKLYFTRSKPLDGDEFSNFVNQCLKCYQIATKYLVEHLPLHYPVIEYAQYLHHDMRDSVNSTTAIFNRALKITQVLDGCLNDVFQCSGSPSDIIDEIRSQWCQYQFEEIPESFYEIECDVSPGVPRPRSYWPHALASCGIEEEASENVPKLRRIDDYWQSVGAMVKVDGGIQVSSVTEFSKKCFVPLTWQCCSCTWFLCE